MRLGSFRSVFLSLLSQRVTRKPSLSLTSKAFTASVPIFHLPKRSTEETDRLKLMPALHTYAALHAMPVQTIKRKVIKIGEARGPPKCRLCAAEHCRQAGSPAVRTPTIALLPLKAHVFLPVSFAALASTLLSINQSLSL